MNPINLASNNDGCALDEFPKNKIDEFSNKQQNHIAQQPQCIQQWGTTNQRRSV